MQNSPPNAVEIYDIQVMYEVNSSFKFMKIFGLIFHAPFGLIRSSEIRDMVFCLGFSGTKWF